MGETEVLYRANFFPSPQVPSASIKTVLVVDDEEPVRELTARVLSGAGYRVITAHDGFHALRLLGQVVEGIDLVLTDIRMPGMSGIQLAERMRARPALQLLFMSGYASDRSSLPGPVLPKPFSHADLIGQVRQLLEA